MTINKAHEQSQDRKMAGALALACRELVEYGKRTGANLDQNPFANAIECMEWFETENGPIR